eukprot:s1365_g25.t2
MTRSIPRARPPPHPAGLGATDAVTRERWENDQYRYPPYVYQEKFLVKGPDGLLRTLQAAERELLMGFPKGYTAAMLKKKPETAAEIQSGEDIRCSALGNSFHTNTVAALFDKAFATAGMKAEKGAEQIVAEFVSSLETPPEPDLPPVEAQSEDECDMLSREDDAETLAGEITNSSWELMSHHFPTEEQLYEHSMKLSVQLVAAFIRRTRIEALPSKESRAKARKKLGKLKHQVLSKATEVRYSSAFKDFIKFHKFPHNFAVGSFDEFDDTVGEYIEFLWETGEPKSLANYTLAAIQFYRPQTKHRLPASWKLVKIWNQVEMPVRATPMTPEVMLAFAGVALKWGQPTFAWLLVVGYALFLRTGEILQLAPGHVTLAGPRAIEAYLAHRPELRRDHMAGRSFEEAAQVLQSDLLEKHAMNTNMGDEVRRLRGANKALLRQLRQCEGEKAKLVQQLQQARWQLGIAEEPSFKEIAEGVLPSSSDESTAFTCVEAEPQERSIAGQGEQDLSRLQLQLARNEQARPKSSKITGRAHRQLLSLAAVLAAIGGALHLSKSDPPGIVHEMGSVKPVELSPLPEPDMPEISSLIGTPMRSNVFPILGGHKIPARGRSPELIYYVEQLRSRNREELQKKRPERHQALMTLLATARGGIDMRSAIMQAERSGAASAMKSSLSELAAGGRASLKEKWICRCYCFWLFGIFESWECHGRCVIGVLLIVMGAMKNLTLSGSSDDWSFAVAFDSEGQGVLALTIGCSAGAVLPLVELLRETAAPGIQEAAAAALGILCADGEAAQSTLLRAGAVPALVRLLGSDAPVPTRAAASALRNLAANHNQAQLAIAQAGAVAPLIHLLSHSDRQLQAQAASALGNLAGDSSENHFDKQVMIAQAGALTPLVRLLRTTDSAEVREACASALRMLATNNADNQVAVAHAGAIQPLVQLLRDEAPSVREEAAAALGNLVFFNDETNAGNQVLSDKGGNEGKQVVSIVQQMMEDNRKSPVTAGQTHPIIILEGLDGTGKTTIVEGLQQKMGEVNCLRSPPDCLSSFRPHFDGQVPHVRRAFYLVGNYACAFNIRKNADKPIVIDRFWPSTMAYALAIDHQVSPDEMPKELEGALTMPLDLQDLMPGPVVWLLLHLPEEERVGRVRHRAGDGSGMTREEKKLENPNLADRLMKVYRALRIGDAGLVEINASGSTEEVLARVQKETTSKCLKESKQCLARLRDAGMQKLNLSGGEPFLHPKALGNLVRFCKEELHLESVSIVSNGSMIKREWMEMYGKYLDILAISCDSFVEETNVHIGRGRGEHLDQLENIHKWCDEFTVLFKINSVINKHNVNEDSLL